MDPVESTQQPDIVGQTLEVVAALSVRDGRLFLARRAQGLLDEGLWELPGGKVEPGESPAQALLRELAEELSVVACIDGASEIWKFRLPDRNVLFTVFPVRFLTIPVLSSSHDACIWMKPDELADYRLASFDGPSVMSWVNRMKLFTVQNEISNLPGTSLPGSAKEDKIKDAT